MGEHNVDLVLIRDGLRALTGAVPNCSTKPKVLSGRELYS